MQRTLRAPQKMPRQCHSVEFLAATKERSMPGYYELKRAGNCYCFTLKTAVGETLLTSELHTTKGGAEYAIVSVRKHSEIETSYQRKIAISGSPYFTLQSANGER